MKKIYSIPLEEEELITIAYALGQLAFKDDRDYPKGLSLAKDPHEVYSKINNFMKKLEKE